MKRSLLWISVIVAVLLTFAVVVPAAGAASAYIFTKPLTLGSRGTEVTVLQNLLITEGLLVIDGGPTGYFGYLTKAAVASLQTQNGLEAVGSVGPKTRAVLNKLSALLAKLTTPSGTPTTPTVNTTATTQAASVVSVAPVIPPASTPTTTTPTPLATTTTSNSQHSSHRNNQSSSSNTTTTNTSAPAATLPPLTLGAMQWGVYPGDNPSDLTSVESLVGKQANIEAIFRGWSDSFPSEYASTLCPNKTLLLFWENTGFSLDNIISGKYDSYLKTFSSSAAAYKCPVILSLFHEMNGNWDEWDGTVGNNSPAKLISAWQHVHGLVTAPNVKWAWVINNDSVPETASNAASVYYPGDAYVDYVGVDGFNFGSPWQTFGQIFDPPVAMLQQYHKPIYIFSMGSVPGGAKAAWITDALAVHIKTYSNIAGWVWFNQNGSDGNWLINSDTASLTAFKAILP